MYFSAGSSLCHSQARSEKCRNALYALKQCGLSYPGLNSESKSSLYNISCQPVLVYGCEGLNMCKTSIVHLEQTQGQIVKQFCGLGKRHRHTKLQYALNIERVSSVINRSVISLFKRICKVESPIRQLCFYLTSLFISRGVIIPGTIVERVISLGFSPVDVMFTPQTIYNDSVAMGQDGVVDSMRALLRSGNIGSRHSAEFNLLSLLTRAF